MGRLRRQRRSTRLTLLRIPAIHSRHGIRRSRTTTCRSNGSLSAGSMTTGMRACPTGRARAELRHRVPGGVPYTNNGFPQYFACNNGNSSMSLSLSGAQTACGAQGSSVWFPDLRRDESFHRPRHHGQVLTYGIEWSGTLIWRWRLARLDFRRGHNRIFRAVAGVRPLLRPHSLREKLWMPNRSSC